MSDTNKILDVIRSQIKSSYIKLPSGISMLWIKSDTIEMHFSSELLICNMQEDKASFEAWAAILKRWIPQVEKIIVTWEPPRNINDRHYQRFLFRLIHFKNIFDWFAIENSCQGYLSGSEYGKSGIKYYLNKPGKRTSPDSIEAITVSSRESDLESFIYNNKNNLIKLCNLSFLDRQLPVGVFKDKIKNGSQIFTSGKSAVDLWGITNDNKLSLFELKNNRNKKAGVISEILFYSFVFSDVQNKVIEITSDAENVTLKKIPSTIGIQAYILAPKIHPLIDKDLIEILNKGLLSCNIVIDGITISDSTNGNLVYQKF